MIDELRAHLEVLYGAALALGIVLLLTPGVGRLGRLLGVIDEPGERRRIHVLPVPRLGGIALFLGIVVPALAFLELEGAYRGIVLGAALATTVGLVDDVRRLPWWAKLGGQSAAAAVALGFGVVIERFTLPFIEPTLLSDWIAYPATFLWIIAIMNMVNFLDGLDGLAAGICAIAGSTFAVIELSLGKPQAAVLAAIVGGACFGFLHHNFYPARIFMGDSGALLLGFVLATVAVQGLLKTAAITTLFFPLVVLAIPILDTSFVVARRLKHREKVYLGDQAHFHHRFLRRGFSQRRAVLWMYAWCLTLAAAALATRFLPPRPHGDWDVSRTAIDGAIAVAALAASVYTMYLLEIIKLGSVRERRAEQAATARKTA